MNIKYYLDARSGEEPFPLKLVISPKGKSALLPVNVRLNKKQFNDQKERIENHPNKVFLNNFITQRKIDVQELVLKLDSKKLSRMSATDIKNYLKESLEGSNVAVTIGKAYDDIIVTKGKNTSLIFQAMRNKLLMFEPHILDYTFEDINNKFVNEFYDFLLSEVSINSAAQYINKFQVMFHWAIDNEITENYPFKKVKVKHANTKKRNLTIEQLRYIFNNDFGRNQRGADCFKLIFMLIGINLIDLYNLQGIDRFGRIEYERHKTGKLYSILVEDEAREIIEKEGFKFGYSSFNSFYQSIHRFLEIIGKDIEIDVILTSYWARHSWASIASDLDFSKDVIAHALGHGKKTVTDTYINFNIKKVDKANRAVIDYVLGKNQSDS